MSPKEISRYVRLHFGNLVTAEDPKLVEGHWETNLKVDYPTIIRDDRTNERIIRFLSFRNLGQLRFNQDFRIMGGASSNEECAKVLRGYLRRWRERTERIVVEASARNLARVGRMREALNPIGVIVYKLLNDNEISQAEISMLSRPRKSRQYLSLLEQNEIVRKTETGYTYGNAFISIQKKVKEENPSDYFDAVRESIIGYVIRENYPVIRGVFKISRLEPYVHMDNCYYEPALQAGKLVYQRADSLIERYNRVYARASPDELKPILHELTEINALNKEGDYFYGTDSLFAHMQQMQSETPEFASLVA